MRMILDILLLKTYISMTIVSMTHGERRMPLVDNCKLMTKSFFSSCEYEKPVRKYPSSLLAQSFFSLNENTTDSGSQQLFRPVAKNEGPPDAKKKSPLAENALHP